MRPGMTSFCIWLFGGVAKGGTGRGGEGGGTFEQHISDKPTLIRCGETYCTWQWYFT